MVPPLPHHWKAACIKSTEKGGYPNNTSESVAPNIHPRIPKALVTQTLLKQKNLFASLSVYVESFFTTCIFRCIFTRWCGLKIHWRIFRLHIFLLGTPVLSKMDGLQMAFDPPCFRIIYCKYFCKFMTKKSVYNTQNLHFFNRKFLLEIS